MKLPLFILLFVAADVGKTQSPIPATEAELARRVAGCYRLDDGPWRADSVRAGDVSTAHTPLFFELTDQRLKGWDRMQSSERPMFAARTARDAFVYWQHISRTAPMIRVSAPLQLAGVELTLARAGRDLTGTVTAFTDAVEMGKPWHVTRRVRARRVECARPL